MNNELRTVQPDNITDQPLVDGLAVDDAVRCGITELYAGT